MEKWAILHANVEASDGAHLPATYPPPCCMHRTKKPLQQAHCEHPRRIEDRIGPQIQVFEQRLEQFTTHHDPLLRIKREVLVLSILIRLCSLCSIRTIDCTSAYTRHVYTRVTRTRHDTRAADLAYANFNLPVKISSS